MIRSFQSYRSPTSIDLLTKQQMLSIQKFPAPHGERAFGYYSEIQVAIKSSRLEQKCRTTFLEESDSKEQRLLFFVYNPTPHLSSHVPMFRKLIEQTFRLIFRA